MDALLRNRLDRLEHRIAAIESHLGLAAATPRPVVEAPPSALPVLPVEPAAQALPTLPPPLPASVEAAPVNPPEPAVEPIAPVPQPVRPPSPVRLPARPPAPPARASFDFERFFGLAVLGRIGIAAVVMAAVYFSQLGWGHLSPAMRVVAIYGVAAAMIAAGALLRPRAAPKYIAMLWGGGMSLAYLAGVLARLHYEVIGPTAALLLLVASCALGQVLARRLRLEALATIALVGAFAAPVLVGQPSASPTGFYVYLLSLHTWAAWTEHRWRWRQARLLAVVATAALVLGWLFTNSSPGPLSIVLHLEAVLLGLIAPELCAIFARRAVADVRWSAVIIATSLAQAGLLTWTMSQDMLPGFGLAAGAVGLAAGALLAARTPAGQVRGADLSRLGGVLVAIGAYVVWNGSSLPDAPAFDQPWWRLGSLVAAAAALLAVRRWTIAADLAIAVAGSIGAVAVAAQSAPGVETRLQATLMLLVPIALVVFGRSRQAPTAGLVLGGALTFFGLRSALTFAGPATWWLPIELALTGCWIAFGLLIGQRRNDVLLRTTAQTMLLSARGALGLAAGWMLQLAITGWSVLHEAVPVFALAAAPLALVAAAVVARRAPELREHAADLGRLGGVLLVFGAFTAWNLGAADATGFDQPWSRLPSLVAAAGAVLALRRLTGAGELAAAVAAVLGAGVVLLHAEPTVATRCQAGLILLVPIALVAFGRAKYTATAGLCLGGALTFFGLRSAQTFAHPVLWWLPIDVALTSCWAGLVLLLARQRRDELACRTAGDALLGARMGLVPAGLWLLQFATIGWPTLHGAVPGFGLAAASLALAAAAVIARRAPELPEHAAGLAQLGGVLLVFGAFAAWNLNAADATGFDQPWPRLLSLVAAAGAVLALRRRTGTGDLAITAAALLGSGVVLLQGDPTTASRCESALVLLVPAALVVFGAVPWAPAVGLVLGTVLAFFGCTQQFSFTGADAAWLSIGLGAAGGVAALGALIAGWRRDRWLLITATALLAALGVGWSLIALQPAAAGDADVGLPPFLNLRFLSALAILALLEFGRRKLRQPRAVDAIVFAAITLAFGYLASLIETLELVRSWPQGWSAVTVSVHTLLFAGGMLVAGFVKRQPLLRWPGLCGFGIVVVKVSLFDLRAVDTPLRVLVTGVLGVVLLLGAWLYARNRAQPSTKR